MTTLQEQVEEFDVHPVTFVDLEIPFCPLRYGKGICSPDARTLFDIEGSSGWSASADAQLLDDDAWRLDGVRSLKINKTGTTEAYVLADRDDLEDIGDLTGRKMRIAFNVA
ncbi:MAG: hypothetical protein ACYTG5_20045, partial [Planctomycetota bacterium]